MKIVALLPMKANSERVQGKNFKIFGTKPLFRWVLDSLLSVDEIDRVIINTDARSKLEENHLVDSNRILIRDRKDELCGDLVSMNLIIGDDVNNIDADIYLMTHTTNPFLSSKSIKNALDEFKQSLMSNNSDSLFTVNKIQTRFYDANRKPINHNPNILSRTQDLEPWYEENSNLYLFTKKSFLETKARIGSNPIMFETPLHESIDIDTQDDWDLAEIMIKYFESKTEKTI